MIESLLRGREATKTMKNQGRRGLFLGLQVMAMCLFLQALPQVAWGGTQKAQLMTSAPSGVTTPTVTLTPGNIAVTGTAVTLANSTTYTINVTNNDVTGNYQLEGVTVDSGSELTCGANCGTFTTASSNSTHQIVVYFKSKVAASAGTGVTAVAPSTPQFVSYNGTQAFTVTPAACKMYGSLSGSCGGAVASNIYTTGAITSSCAETINYVTNPATYTVTVTQATGGTIAPGTTSALACGSNQTFSITADSTHYISKYTVDGVDTVPGAGVITASYTFSSIQASHTLTATYALRPTSLVSTNAGTGSTFSPASATVPSGNATSFGVTTNGYHITNITGCGGTWDGGINSSTYLTGAINSPCTVTTTTAINTYTATGTAGTNGTISSTNPQTVNYNTSAAFTLNPTVGFYASGLTANTCGGAIVGNTYTTAAMTANCAFTVNFTAITPVATGTAGSNGTISSTNPKTVTYNTAATFTLSPSAGYFASGVSGTCGGSISGTTYTTDLLNGNCNFTISFSKPVATGTAGPNGSISSTNPLSVNYNSAGTFTLLPSTGYYASGVTGTCGGSIAGTTYTTGTLTGNCSFNISFALQTFTVSSTVAGSLPGASISPASTTGVGYNTTTSFTVVTPVGYNPPTFSGPSGCGSGSLVGSTYTTGAITGACTVTATYTIQTFSVGAVLASGFPTGANITPASQANVPYNTTTTFTVAAVPHYTVTFAGANGCGSGSLSGTTYTTGAITGACTVTATYVPGTSTVTVNQSGGSGAGTVTCCGSGCTNTWLFNANASYSIIPPNGSVLSNVTVSPAAFSPAPVILPAGIACGGLMFPVITGNQTLNVTYGHGDTVTKTTYTNSVLDNPAGSAGGTITSCASGNDLWPDNATASYAITPASGYALATVSAGPTGGPYTSTVTPPSGGYTCASPYTFGVGVSAQALTAYFATAQTVTTTVNTNYLPSVTGGSITSCNGTNTWGLNTTAYYGIAPAAGYMLQSVSVTPAGSFTPMNSGGYTCNGASYQFNMTSNQALTANFVLANTVQINGSTNGGDIRIGAFNGTSTVPYTNVPFNSAQTFYIIPPAGKGISSVSFDNTVVTGSVVCPNNDFTALGNPGTSNATSCTYTVANLGTTGHTISVLFDNAYQVSATTSTSGCGQTSGGGFIGATAPGVTAQTVNVVNGKSVSFTLSPNGGFVINDIQVAGFSQIASPIFSSYTLTTGSIHANTSVAIAFTPFYTIATQAVSTPAGSTASGTFAPVSAQVICGGNSTFSVTPTPPATITDVSVNTGSGFVSQGVVTSYSFTNVQSNATLKVTFNQEVFQASNYSIVPPFVQAAVLPNLLLMIDNSASQYDLQYDSTGQCYDNNAYNDTTTYAGYFTGATFYSYVTASNRFEPLPAGGVMPSTCTFRTPFFCVKMGAGTAGSRPMASITLNNGSVVNGFIASGNFLNYLATSKLDLQKMILTGGKYDVPTSSMVAESRGCMGKRFVKMISNTQASGSTESLVGVTFSIRGPSSSDPDYVNPTVQNGTTRIDIYDAAYNLSSCTSAINDSSYVEACGTGVGGSNLKSNVFIHVMHVCSKGSGNGNMNSVERDCDADWRTNYGSDPSIASSLIVNDQAGDGICSSVLKHSLINGRDTGYLGLCCNPGTTDCSKQQNWPSACEANMMADFCGQQQSSTVIDPSGATTATGNDALPSFVIDAGTNALGTVVADYLAKVYQPTAPTGLIQQFQNFISFGVMSFNYDGSATECNDGVHNLTSRIFCAKACTVSGTACYLDSDCPSHSCQPAVKTDGARVLPGGYIGDPVGDHSSGLINVIDSIQATSWTPFAEAYYDAIGYFSNNAFKDMRLQPGDYDPTKPPPSASCILNNILIVTDGMSTADQNPTVNALASQPSIAALSTNDYGSCTGYAGSKNISALAWLARNRNIRGDLTQASDTVTANNQNITTYVTYSGPDVPPGNTDPCFPKTLMNATASHGGTTLFYATTYDTMLQNMKSALIKISSSSASGTAASILNNSQGSGANLLQAVFFPKKVYNYDVQNGLVVPGNTQQDIATWIGELQNLWFFVDPKLNNSTVREDTNLDYTLSLKNDYVVNFGYAQNQATVSYQQDVNGAGNGLNLAPVTKTDAQGGTTLDGLNSLWKAGLKLWSRNLSSDPRQIYTVLATPPSTGDGTTGTLVKFSSATSGSPASDFNNNATAQSYLQVAGADSATLKNNTNALVDYISGIDQASYRPRKVTIPGCGLLDTEACKREWKLGDIVNSTPKLDSNLALNTYSLAPPNGYGDVSYGQFIGSNNYQKRGMAFVGGNDGMLHAFRLGILDVKPQMNGSGTVNTDLKARMTNADGTTATYSSVAGGVVHPGSDLGREEWAFIPMNALPYLKYLGDPNYTHLFYVDDTVTLSDMSIGVTSGSSCSSSHYENCTKQTTLSSGNLDMANTSWRTVLIGGMGLGGASRDAGASCSDNVATGTCVKTPVSGVGFSSYFALDVTNPATLPDSSNAGAVKFLWEFNANGQLGYSLSGPAIVRMATADATQNGKWFAVFASGPTGPIESTSHIFYGKSNQPLTLYVVDVGTGKLAATIPTGVNNAFGGSLTTAVIDTDRNYSDDAVYVGYVQASDATLSASTTWTKGGVLRLQTNGNMDPTQWTVSPLISNIGPVTTSVAKLQDNKVTFGGTTGKLWLYFGSGRFFYKTDSPAPSPPYRLYGITDPCYSMHGSGPAFTPTGPRNTLQPNCTASAVSEGSLKDQSGSASQAPVVTVTPDYPGWFVNLAMSETLGTPPISYSAERVITNPIANSNGTVFFSTLLPSTDICGVGGNTYTWALKYDSGAAPLTATMKGSILLQVSTGDLSQIPLATAFGGQANLAYNNRRTSSPTAGVPPTGSGMVGMNRPQPTRKILHIQEK